MLDTRHIELELLGLLGEDAFPDQVTEHGEVVIQAEDLDCLDLG